MSCDIQIVKSVFPINKDMLLYNHNATIKLRILTSIQYYHVILRLHSHFMHGPDNVLLVLLEDSTLESLFSVVNAL